MLRGEVEMGSDQFIQYLTSQNSIVRYCFYVARGCGVGAWIWDIRGTPFFKEEKRPLRSRREKASAPLQPPCLRSEAEQARSAGSEL